MGEQTAITWTDHSVPVDAKQAARLWRLATAVVRHHQTPEECPW